MVSPFCFSLPATSLSVSAALGHQMWHQDPKGETFLFEVSMLSRLVHVNCQKCFLVYQASSMYKVASFGRGSAYHGDLEQLTGNVG